MHPIPRTEPAGESASQEKATPRKRRGALLQGLGLSRWLALRIHFVLDQCLPPILRDSPWLLWLPLKLFFGDASESFAGFKARAPYLSREEFLETYRRLGPYHVRRETDLNQGCAERILGELVGDSILEVGCGRGFLLRRFPRNFEITACDIQVSTELSRSLPEVHFAEAFAESLPFDDARFDTVVCTHTLEHVQDLHRAIRELRRVARRRLIVVVPKQRPYIVTFDLHLHFFPYPHSLLAAMAPCSRALCEEIEGDLFYLEECSRG